MNKYNVIIVGGGLAGLTNALALSRAGIKVLLIEKRNYPFHRVCGEYISNEVLPYLNSLDANPLVLNPSAITNLTVSAPSGKSLSLKLDLGGFGVSRYSLDNFLYNKCKEQGVVFVLNAKVTSIVSRPDGFEVSTICNRKYDGDFVIGSFGKRSNLDKEMNRPFFYKRSPYLAVKYHIYTDYPADSISLHNFQNGYCGISKVEGERYCLCYLTTRENLKKYGSIPEMESKLLSQNPFLLSLFKNSEFLYDKPLVINEITFDKKDPVEQGIFMAGDAAGMITPLCGNGMAMAIHSAKILSGSIINYYTGEFKSREKVMKVYQEEWTRLFKIRIMYGRNIQRLFGSKLLTDVTVHALKVNKPLARWLVKKTHGTPF